MSVTTCNQNDVSTGTSMAVTYQNTVSIGLFMTVTKNVNNVILCLCI